MNKQQLFQQVKLFFLLLVCGIVFFGLFNQLGLSVSASQLPSNPGQGDQPPASGGDNPTTGGGSPPDGGRPQDWPTTNIPQCPDIEAPSGLNVNVSGGSVNWNAPAGAVSYKWRVDDTTANGWTGSCGSMNSGDGCNDDYRSNSFNWSFVAGHNYHVWVHAVSNRCEGPEAGTNFTVPGAPTTIPTATPVPPINNNITLCGKTGVKDPGYSTISSAMTCTPSDQYLYVNVAGGYLSAACLRIPDGNTKTANGCGYTAQVVAPTATPTPVPQGGPAPTTLCPGTPQAVTGVMAAGYSPMIPSQCATNLYLYVTKDASGLSNACIAMPAGAVRSAGGCTYTVAGVAPTATPTPVPGAPTATPTPVPAGAQAFACPTNGGTFMINGSIINCNAQSQSQTQTNNQNVTVNNYNNPTPGATLASAGVGRKVAGVSYPVKELPKTGLPLLAWAFSGLLPLGLGLKRLSGKEGEDEAGSALYLWEKREYLRS